MAKLNKAAKATPDKRMDQATRLAGGAGAMAAIQDAEALLRRAVLTTLLWEDAFYQGENSVAADIAALVPQVLPKTVAALAVEAREVQGLRHVPLLIVREMARHAAYKGFVADTLARVIQRPDELAEFLALYWKDGKQPLAAQVKRGLAEAFGKFDAYQLAKYDREGAIKLRDVAFLVHPRPSAKQLSQGQERKIAPSVKRENYKRGPVARHGLLAQLVSGELPTPDTWEVALSAGKDKRATWERLIVERKLGGLAFLRNLANMEAAKVSPDVIRQGFATLANKRLLPLNFLAAALAAPNYTPEIETAMLACLGNFPKLAGVTVLIVDVSGSMGQKVSERSTLTRGDAAVALALMAREVCEHPVIYVTAGDDGRCKHATARVEALRGFGLVREVARKGAQMGGGGIFTRQALEYVRQDYTGSVDRVMVFSDSQDCDQPQKRVPAPFGARNYIIDVGGHTRGVNYSGVWTAEITGWSQHFLTFIAGLEGVGMQPESDE